jgi:trigger factor
MKVSTEDLGDSQKLLTIEAEASELEKSLDQAYRHLVNEVNIPGFRKGKAPRAILVQHIGKGSLLEEALEHLVPQLYRQAIESEKLEPIAEPQIEIAQTEPVIIKAKVPLKPEIKLGDYHSLKLEPGPAAKVTQKEITAALEQLRERQGAWIPADRPVELGDLVTLNIQADVEGKPWLSHKDILYEVNKDSSSPVPGFASQLQGIEKNKEKAFSLTIPDDYPLQEMRGKDAAFKVTVTEVKRKQLPELDDKLAQGVGYDDLADMKKKVAADLKADAEARKRSELRQKALDALVEMSEMKYPPILEDEEINELVKSEAQRLGFREVTDYLKKANKTTEEVEKELRPIAKKRLVQSLVLGKLAEEEKIEISESEVDNRIEELAGAAEDKENAKQFFSLAQVRKSIEQSLRTQKTLDRLLQAAIGDVANIAKEEE